MAGPVEWVKDTASSYIIDPFYSVTSTMTGGISASVSAVQSAFGSVVSGALSYVFTPDVKEQLVEGWDGFSRSLNINAVGSALFTRPDTRRVLLHALYNNLMAYMGTVMLYEYGVKSAMHQMPGMGDSWAEWGLDRVAHLFFLRLAMDTFVSNALAYSSLNTALSTELPSGAHFKPCKHVVKDPTALTAANLMSTPYFYGNLAVSSAVRVVPVVGRFIEWPLKTLIYGQSLVEYKLASAQQCAQDRYEILARNNAYSFGFGLSFVASVAVWNAAISYFTGVNSPHIKDALFNFIYMYHMLAAYLIDKPLPGKKYSIDVFSYPRQATDRIIKDGVEQLAPLLSGPQGNIYEKLKRALATRPVCLAKHVLLPNSLQSFPDFMQRQDAKIFLELHEDGVRKGVSAVLEVRKSNIVRVYKYLGPVIPKKLVSDETRNLLDNVVLNSELKKWLEQVILYVDKAHNYAKTSPQVGRVVKVTFRDEFDPDAAIQVGNIEAEPVPEQPQRGSVSTENLGGKSRRVLILGGSSAKLNPVSGSTPNLSVANSSSTLFAKPSVAASGTAVSRPSQRMLYGPDD